MKTKKQILERRIKNVVALFMILLMLSGVTAFPVQTELQFLAEHFNWFPQFMQSWLLRVNAAVQETGTHFPFLFYGYDWLAYAHIVIALFFIGVYRDPVANAWVLRIGMLACAGVFVLAFAASVRGIPFFWTMIDCSFGLFGIIPLLLVQKWINQLEQMESAEFINSPHAL